MLYPFILSLHNLLRWLVLGSLLVALINAFAQWGRPASRTLTTWRVVATSVAHTQLLIGFYLYAISPVVKYYWSFRPGFGEGAEFPFFGLIHISLMTSAVVVMTIGSSKAKRQPAEQQARTVALYFLAGLVLILVAIPWPFSPLAARPWVRSF